MTDPEIAIVGGGIGGLTLALMLHECGIKSKIYESAPELVSLGVGINILPHATVEYERLGLVESLLNSGVELNRYCWFNRYGQEIYSEPRGRVAGYETPQISIHRGAFQQILLETVIERLGADAIIADHHLSEFESDEHRAFATFTKKSTGETQQQIECDALICCDGIHSAARQHFYPDQGPPRWGGNMMWRMTVELDKPILGGNTMFSAGTGDAKVVGYEISAASKARGRSLFNWIAEVKLGNDGDTPPEREDWNRVASIDEFIAYFKDWQFDWLDVPSLAAQSGHAFAFPMVDRDPVRQWTFNRVTLLGDAAHPMWPIGSNGASQAVLDCRCLTDALAAGSDIPAALIEYENDRRPATAKVVHANRERAHDRMLDIVHERAPTGFNDINDVVDREEITALVRGYRETARFDPAQVNAKRS